MEIPTEKGTVVITLKEGGEFSPQQEDFLTSAIKSIMAGASAEAALEVAKDEAELLAARRMQASGLETLARLKRMKKGE